MTTEIPQYKLGRFRSEPDERTLLLADYLTPAAPAPPAACTYSAVPGLRTMAGNATAGDCTVAGIAHAMALWLKWALKIDLEVTDAQALALYSAITGYKPNVPSTDRGASLLQVLKYVTKHGAFGRKIGPYLQVDPKNTTHIKQAIFLFGCVYTGCELPDNVLPSASSIPPWTKTSGRPDPNNGHCTIQTAYTSEVIDTATWAAIVPTSWGFEKKYFDEAWVILSPDWRSNAPNGFKAAQLDADLTAIRG